MAHPRAAIQAAQAAVIHATSTNDTTLFYALESDEVCG